MAYIGRDIRTGAFRQLDDISSGFDGSDTTHTMQVNSTNVSVGDVNQILLSLGGVIQKPGTDFTVSGSTLTFTTAPAANTSFFAILLGSDNGGTVTPTDGSVTGDKIASNLSIATNVTITTADNTDTLTLTSTDADASSGPNIVLNRDSGSPADNDIVGQFTFRADNDAGEATDYCRMRTHLQDVSDGTEDGNFRLFTLVAGSELSRISVASAETIFNEDSGNIDFRVESNDIDDCLFVNAGSNTVCLGRQAGEGNERLSVEQTEADWCQVNIHSRSSGNIYMFNNKFTGQAPDNNVSYFTNFQDYDGGATIRFRVFSDGDVQNHDNSYGSTSDERIKSEIVDANSQWDDIKALKVRNYKRNDDIAQYGDKAWVQIGVIAQELEASGMDKLVKNEVLWDKDDPEVKSGEATEGDVKEYKGVKYSVLYMKAIKALQEAMAKIETLEADVKTLKGE